MPVQDASQLAKSPMQRVSAIRNQVRFTPKLFFGLGLAASFIPLIGGGISHVFDRMKHASNAKHELKARTAFYSNEIGQILGKDPAKVTVRDFQLAASASPSLGRHYREVTTKQQNENNESLLINGGVTAANFVPLPGAGVAAKLVGEAVTVKKVATAGVQIAKSTVGAMAGGKVAGILAKDSFTSQELVEGIAKQIEEGGKGGQVVNPEMLFIVRLAQDEKLLNDTNLRTQKQWGKKVHQLSPQQLQQVMNAAEYRPLAMAVTREATSIMQGNMTIQDVGAGAPDLRAGHVGRLQAAANDNPQRGNDQGGWASKIRAEQAALQAPRTVG